MRKVLLILSFLIFYGPLNGMVELIQEDTDMGLANLFQQAEQDAMKFCTLCQENIQYRQTDRKFSCLHSVHNQCYNTGMSASEKENKDFNCPVCREPVITVARIPGIIELKFLWALTKNRPDKISVLRNEEIRKRCLIFADLLLGQNITPEQEADIFFPLFVDSINAGNNMPRLQAILSQRTCLDIQLSLVLEKLNVYENENPKVAHYVSKAILYKTAAEQHKIALEQTQEKLARKKLKLVRERTLNQEIFFECQHAIESKAWLRLGITALASLMTGICVRNLFANQEVNPTHVAIAAAASVAYSGTRWTIKSFMQERNQLLRAVENYQA